jgi:hypothetical protein
MAYLMRGRPARCNRTPGRHAYATGSQVKIELRSVYDLARLEASRSLSPNRSPSSHRSARQSWSRVLSVVFWAAFC